MANLLLFNSLTLFIGEKCPKPAGWWKNGEAQRRSAKRKRSSISLPAVIKFSAVRFLS